LLSYALENEQFDYIRVGVQMSDLPRVCGPRGCPPEEHDSKVPCNSVASGTRWLTALDGTNWIMLRGDGFHGHLYRGQYASGGYT